MSNPFAALANVTRDIDNSDISFTFADIKMHMHDDMCIVDEALLSFEKYSQALDQLDAVSEALESMGGSLDLSLMHVVNQNNQLGKLLGVYIPQAYRFDMADGETTNQGTQATPGTPDAAKTSEEDNKTAGKSVIDKSKEFAKKIWEMLKALFQKIGAGLKSFWTWLKNGFMSNIASNEKLLSALNALGKQKVEQQGGILFQAKGFLESQRFNDARTVLLKLIDAPFLKNLDQADCGKIVLELDNDGFFQKDIAAITGIEPNLLTSALVQITEGKGNGELPSIGMDKTKIAELKGTKKELSILGWNFEFLTGEQGIILSLNEYYKKIQEQKGVVAFFDKAASYDWENAALNKDGNGNNILDPKTAKSQLQAMCKFYTQYNKLYIGISDLWQAHLNALKKFVNVAVGQKTAQPNPEQGAQQAVNNAAAANQGASAGSINQSTEANQPTSPTVQ